MSLLREMRHHSGWTQQDVANATTVDVRTVKRWESDDDPPDRIIRLYRSLFEDGEDVQSIGDVQPVPLEQVMTIVPDPLPLTGRLAPLLGSLPNNEQFTILLGGASGSGKSTAALILAGELADHGTVLLATSEERMRTGTIGIRAKHAGIDPGLIDVAETTTLDDLESLLRDGDYSYVIVDSINELGIDPDEAGRLFQEFSATSFILIAQADATEKRTVGGARWRHLVDVRLWCERNENGQRVVRNLKNRFGPRVDHVTLDGSKSQNTAVQRRSARSSRTSPSIQDTNMDETYRWMVGRLEAELADARQEIRDLRTQLTAKDERIRESTVELARYETRQEALDDAPKKGLGDSFDPDKLVALADRFAPLIGAVTTALLDRGSRQQPTAVHFSSPYGYAQDYTATQPAGQRGTVQPINPSTPPFDDLPGITS